MKYEQAWNASVVTFGFIIWLDMTCLLVQYSARATISLMMMIAFIIFNSSLVPLFEVLCSSNPWEFEFSGFGQNRTDGLGINSPLL